MFSTGSRSYRHCMAFSRHIVVKRHSIGTRWAGIVVIYSQELHSFRCHLSDNASMTCCVTCTAADLQHACELGVAVWDVGFALREGIDHIAQRQEPHVDVDTLLQPSSLCLGSLLPFAACNAMPATLSINHRHGSLRYGGHHEDEAAT